MNRPCDSGGDAIISDACTVRPAAQTTGWPMWPQSLDGDWVPVSTYRGVRAEDGPDGPVVREELIEPFERLAAEGAELLGPDTRAAGGCGRPRSFTRSCAGS